MWRGFWIPLLSILIAAIWADVVHAQESETVYVLAGKLLDVRAGRLLTDQVIVIRGERIERVVPASEATPLPCTPLSCWAGPTAWARWRRASSPT